jgi:hypothetical protein
MNGVEILNVTEHAIMEPAWSWSICFGLFVGIFCFGVLVGFIQGVMDYEISTGIIAGLIIGFICALIASPPLTAAIAEKEVGIEYHYKVTIDDSVSMNEFLDKYEILGQEGKIYTVKERE